MHHIHFATTTGGSDRDLPPMRLLRGEFPHTLMTSVLFSMLAYLGRIHTF